MKRIDGIYMPLIVIRRTHGPGIKMCTPPRMAVEVGDHTVEIAYSLKAELWDIVYGLDGIPTARRRNDNEEPLLTIGTISVPRAASCIHQSFITESITNESSEHSKVCLVRRNGSNGHQWCCSCRPWWARPYLVGPHL